MKAKQHTTNIFFPLGGKGGVGKTFTILQLLEYLQSEGVSTLAIDADDETSVLSRMWPDVQFIQIRNPRDIDNIVEHAVKGEHQAIVVDLPARCSRELHEWFALLDSKTIETLGIRFLGLGIIADTKDSIQSVLNWKEFLGDKVSYAIVLNEHFDLSIYGQSNARKTFEKSGIPEIRIPKLDESFVVELDRRNWTISRALNEALSGELSHVMARIRLQRFQEQLCEQFAKLNK